MRFSLCNEINYVCVCVVKMSKNEHIDTMRNGQNELLEWARINHSILFFLLLIASTHTSTLSPYHSNENKFEHKFLFRTFKLYTNLFFYFKPFLIYFFIFFARYWHCCNKLTIGNFLCSSTFHCIYCNSASLLFLWLQAIYFIIID